MVRIYPLPTCLHYHGLCRYHCHLTTAACLPACLACTHYPIPLPHLGFGLAILLPCHWTLCQTCLDCYCPPHTLQHGTLILPTHPSLEPCAMPGPHHYPSMPPTLPTPCPCRGSQVGGRGRAGLPPRCQTGGGGGGPVPAHCAQCHIPFPHTPQDPTFPGPFPCHLPSPSWIPSLLPWDTLGA